MTSAQIQHLDKVVAALPDVSTLAPLRPRLAGQIRSN
jgi:hypothetical protein